MLSRGGGLRSPSSSQQSTAQLSPRQQNQGHRGHQPPQHFVTPDDSDLMDDSEDDDDEDDDRQCEPTLTIRATTTMTTRMNGGLHGANASSASTSENSSASGSSAPMPIQPLIQVAPRFYFAIFDSAQPLPSARTLNASANGSGKGSAIFPAKPPTSAGLQVSTQWEFEQQQDDQPALKAKGKGASTQGWAPNALPNKFHWISVDPPKSFRRKKRSHRQATHRHTLTRHSASAGQDEDSDVASDACSDEDFEEGSDMGKGGFEVQKYEYARFYDDWGPLNMAMVWMFCDDVERLMDRPDLREHGIVLYTSSAPRRKTNAATLAALRSVLVYHLAPHDAFHPFSTLDVQPFRDAGYGRSDFFLSIQDVLYGAWRAQTLGFADLATFDVDEYLYSEQPQNGDWNWITPSFIAFASPNDPSYVRMLRDQGLEAQTSPARSTKAKANSVAGGGDRTNRTGSSKTVATLAEYYAEDGPKARAFHQRKQNLLSDFRKRNVQLVVRLNNPLYDKDIFEDVGIAHIDLYFDDGSNPSTAILREFIQRADAVVERGGVVAVHCKAGLGRTGVLIGAYLIWKYGFNAPEAIAWMRVQRPGCVVGPQQQFVYEQCIDWVRWGEQARAMKMAESKIAKEKELMQHEIKRLQVQLLEAQRMSRSSSVTATDAAATAAAANNAEPSRKRKIGDAPDAAQASTNENTTNSTADPTYPPQREPGDSDSEADVATIVTPRPKKSATLTHVGISDAFAGAAPSAAPHLSSTVHHHDAAGGEAAFVPQTAPRTHAKPKPIVGQPRKPASPQRQSPVRGARVMSGQSPQRQLKMGGGSGNLFNIPTTHTLDDRLGGGGGGVNTGASRLVPCTADGSAAPSSASPAPSAPMAPTESHANFNSLVMDSDCSELMAMSFRDMEKGVGATSSRFVSASMIAPAITAPASSSKRKAMTDSIADFDNIVTENDCSDIMAMSIRDLPTTPSRGSSRVSPSATGRSTRSVAVNDSGSPMPIRTTAAASIAVGGRGGMNSDSVSVAIMETALAQPHTGILSEARRANLVHSGPGASTTPTQPPPLHWDPMNLKSPVQSTAAADEKMNPGDLSGKCASPKVKALYGLKDAGSGTIKAASTRLPTATLRNSPIRTRSTSRGTATSTAAANGRVPNRTVRPGITRGIPVGAGGTASTASSGSLALPRSTTSTSARGTAGSRTTASTRTTVSSRSTSWRSSRSERSTSGSSATSAISARTDGSSSVAQHRSNTATTTSIRPRTARIMPTVAPSPTQAGSSRLVVRAARAVPRA